MHHVVLVFSSCQQIADATYPHPRLILGIHAFALRPGRSRLLVGHVRNNGVFRGTEVRLCHRRDVLLNCLAGGGRQTAVAVPASLTRLTNAAFTHHTAAAAMRLRRERNEKLACSLSASSRDVATNYNS